MIELLRSWDIDLFHWINGGWSHPVLDVIMPLVRNKYAWLPLYVWCIAWIAYRLPWRATGIVLGFVAVSIFASDTISSKLIKYEVRRPRPCQELTLERAAITRISCGSGFSFTSSHAANHFCLAAFLVVVFRTAFGRWRHLWWAWAALVGLAQVYVGVHYPLDIAGGAMVGLIIGCSMGILCLHLLRKPAVSSAGPGSGVA